MNKIINIMACLVLTTLAHAARPLPLDTVNFQVTSKQWVSTQTALLTVNLNATLGNADLVKARADIMDKLSKISVGEWHLTQFDRSQDSSGLEKLSVSAQARVAQSGLTQVYDHAKAVSKPGAVYSVGSIEFTPSLEEMQQVRTTLRERLYQQARDELVRINKVYAGQQYTLNQLVFVEGGEPPEPKPVGMMSAMAVRAAPALTVSQELVMTALVQVASNRQQGA
ncbi:MAG TPA: hypothetical protein DDY37_08100 [Legionella sp.]|nr:hypothetical protein [Legionella sp.]